VKLDANASRLLFRHEGETFTTAQLIHGKNLLVNTIHFSHLPTSVYFVAPVILILVSAEIVEQRITLP
jgi:hypothetical protein